MPKLFRFALLGAFVLSMAGSAVATTWFPKEFTCPVDDQKNTFMVLRSWGSYIYSYPSKYQWLFFPQTESNTYYLCKKCHLATFMWDFDKLPKDKIPEIKKVLEGIKVSKAFKDYTDIPITERLEIIEKVYLVLGKSDTWWEQFYRIKGYHYGKEGDVTTAAASRRKSLESVQKQLQDPKSEQPKKLLFYISASMKHFLGDDKGALEDLQKVLETKYEDKNEKPEEVKSAEEGLNHRAQDYFDRIKSEKDKPRLFDKYSANEH